VRSPHLLLLVLLPACGARSFLPAPEDDSSDASKPDAAGPCEIVFSNGPQGEHTCNGCPVIDGPPQLFSFATSESVFAISSATLGTVSGNLGPGKWFVDAPEGENQGNIAEGAGGSFDTKAPLFCGAQALELGWCNSAGTTSYRYLIERQDCVGGGLHVTLSWGAGANDLELHLIRQGGHINQPPNDCTWTTCVGESPDWGILGDASDNPHKDIDWLTENGVENIELPKLEPIRYSVLVEYWGSGNPITPLLILNAFGTTTPLIGPEMKTRDVWVAATIDATNETVTGSTLVVDCSGSWSSGCQLPIP
jgi:hypothetical protein